MESVRNNKSNTEQKKTPDMENTLSIIHLAINNAIIKSQIYSQLKYSCIYLHVTSTKLLSKRTYPFQCEAGLVQGPHGDGEGCD